MHGLHFGTPLGARGFLIFLLQKAIIPAARVNVKLAQTPFLPQKSCDAPAGSLPPFSPLEKE
jgi:hypothetical protein